MSSDPRPAPIPQCICQRVAADGVTNRFAVQHVIGEPRRRAATRGGVAA